MATVWAQRILHAGVLLVLSTAASAQFNPAPSLPYGQFPQIPIHVGNSPSSVVVGDFNSDALPDIAVVNTVDGTLVLILSNAVGGYTVSSSIAVGMNPTSMVSADFNSDGKPDLAIASQTAIIVLLGNGDGTFVMQPPAPPLQVGPGSLAVGDFNGDKLPDLAFSNSGSNTVTVFLAGKPTPTSVTFTQAGSPITVGNNPASLAVGDFNQDGNLDLVTANLNITNAANGNFTVILGDGTGHFNPGPPVPPGLGPNAYSVVVGDFNRDYIPDLAIANAGTNNITVLLGNGAGGFTPTAASPIAVGFNPFSLTIGDINGDDLLDLAVVNSASNNVTVLIGDGAGGFKAGGGSPFAVGTTPVSAALGDFNGDGLPDLAVANSVDGDVLVLLSVAPAKPVMVSAASYAAPVAYGSIVSIFGTDSGAYAMPAAPAMTKNSTSNCAYGVSATITDSSGVTSAPLALLSAAPQQINAVLPPTGASGMATLTVFSCGEPTIIIQKNSVVLNPFAPGLFSANGTGKGVANAQFVSNVAAGTLTNVFQCSAPIGLISAPMCKPPYLVPTALKSVDTGSTALVLYGTGIRNRASLSSVSVTVGTQTLQPFYAGAAPTSLGEDQINVSLPASLAGSGIVPVTVSVGTATSNAVTVCIENPSDILFKLCPAGTPVPLAVNSSAQDRN